MSAGMIIDGRNQLQEIRQRSFPRQPFAVRVIARIISWIFHPVFVPMMVVAFLVYVHPYLFAGFSTFQKFRVMMSGVMCFTFFPLVTVLLLKGLKFIDTIYLDTQKDRIIPFVGCMIWYFWVSYVWLNFGKTNGGADIPKEAILFASATFVSTIIGLMVNIKMKVSLHAIAMGIVITLFILMAIAQPLHFGAWLTVVFLVTGLVCTARLIVSDHTQAEVYGGLVTGAASIMIARFFVSWLG
jgi:hypothetical protein